jgi:hypothetical protein
VLGECNGSATDTIRRIGEDYNNLREPNFCAFLSLNSDSERRGYFMECDWKLAVHVLHIILWMEEHFLEIVEGQTTICTRSLGARTGISPVSLPTKLQ